MRRGFRSVGTKLRLASTPSRQWRESSRYPVEALAETLAEGISVGNPDMPEFVFEHDEIAEILAYLKSIQDH
jgi:hypothetical protein